MDLVPFPAVALQFNSIQYRHLYAPANEHHVGAHGEETKLQRKIKYMNDKRKKSVNFEKVRFQFCSEGVERESGITQVHRERVPHGRRGVVEPSWTQLGHGDTCRQVGRSYSSPGPPHPTSATADA